MEPSYSIDRAAHQRGLRARLEGLQEQGPSLPFERSRRGVVVRQTTTWSGRPVTITTTLRGISLD